MSRVATLSICLSPWKFLFYIHLPCNGLQSFDWNNLIRNNCLLRSTTEPLWQLDVNTSACEKRPGWTSATLSRTCLVHISTQHQKQSLFVESLKIFASPHTYLILSNLLKCKNKIIHYIYVLLHVFIMKVFAQLTFWIGSFSLLYYSKKL